MIDDHSAAWARGRVSGMSVRYVRRDAMREYSALAVVARASNDC
jgi:hypothetical protein